MNLLLRHPDIRAHALLFALLLLLLWPALGGGKVLFPADILYTYRPWNALAVEAGFSVAHNDLIADQLLQDLGWKSLIHESLRHGELPLWNPGILTGVPFLAAGQPAVLYPPTWLFFGLLPVLQGYGWFALAHLAGAASGCYWLLRAFGAGRAAAVLGGLVFSMSGVMSVSLQWPQITGVYVWFPWVVLAVEEIGRSTAAGSVRRGLAWVLGGSIALCLAWLGGHAETAIYGNILAAAFGLTRCGLVWRGAGRAAAAATGACLALMLGLGVGLASAQLLPQVVAVAGNFREGAASYQDVTGWALPKIQLLAFLVPDVFGNPTHHSYFDLFKGMWQLVTGSMDPAGAPRTYPFWGAKNYVEGTAYIGVLPLVFAGVALGVRRDAMTRFFAGFALVCLLLAFGTPLYAVLFNLPGLNQLHSPFRWLYPYAFCGAVLAGLAFDALMGAASAARSAPQNVASSSLLGRGLLAAGVALTAGLAASWFMAPVTLEWAQRARERSAALAAAFPAPEMLYSYETRNLGWFALLLLLGGAALTWFSGRRRLLTTVICGMVLLDLLAFGNGFVTFGSPVPLNARPPAFEWLKAQPGPFRIAAAGAGDLAPPNSAALAGIDDIRGYESIIPRAYVDFWKLLEPPVDLIYNRLNHFRDGEHLNLRLLGLMNVRYVLSAGAIEGVTMPLVFDEGVSIYENPQWMPRAYAVYQAVAVPDAAAARSAVASPGFDPRTAVVLEGPSPPASRGQGSQPARVVDRTANSVTVEVVLTAPGYLVVAEAYDAGWQARNETGRQLPVLRANSIFRAVRLDAGGHTIRFSYFPDSLKLGVYLSFLAGAGWLLLLGVVVWPRLAARRELSPAQRVTKNSVAPMLAQLLGRTVDFGFAVVMLRVLGPADYGWYSFAVALIGYFAIFTDYGLGTLLIRDVARAPEGAEKLVGRAIGLRLVLCAVSFPVLVAVSWWYHLQFGLAQEAVIAGVLFMVSLFPSGVAGALSARFSAQERMELPAALGVATAVLRAILGVAALLLGAGVVGLGIVSVVASGVNAAVFWWLYARRYGRPGISLDVTAGRQLLRTSAPLMFNSFLNTIFFRIDILLLQAMRGAEAVGLYSTAYKFIDGLLLVPTFVTLALFPLLSRFANESPERLGRTYRQAVKALVLVAVPIAVGFTFLAEDVLRFFFGETYAPAAPALRLLAWFLPLSYLNGVTQYLLIAVNRQRLITLAFGLGAGFNIVANIAVIPRFGMEGSAAVTVLSEVVLLAPFMAGVRASLGSLPFTFGLARGVAASVVMAAALWATRGAPGPVAVLAGVGVYAAALAVLRVLDDEDLRVLRRLAGR
ncbi:MAG: hypothetical protein EXR51_10445 [Dehalococcoidia bacterium]|nr:hypothetical protein [Dehalococcoidia bacterium]